MTWETWVKLQQPQQKIGKFNNTFFINDYHNNQNLGWSSGNAFVSGAGGLRFKSRAGQTEPVSSTIRHRRNIFFKEAVLPGCNDAEIGPSNSLHPLAYYSEYNEECDLISSSEEHRQYCEIKLKSEQQKHSPKQSLSKN